MDVKIKEEALSADNEGELFIQDLVKKIKVETVAVSSDNELDTKIEIKEDLWWLQGSSRDTAYVYSEIQDKDFSSKELPGLYTGVSSNKSASFPDKGLEKVTPECKRARKFTFQEKAVTEVSPVENNAYLQQYDNGKIEATTTYLKQDNLVQQNNIHERNIDPMNLIDKSGLKRNEGKRLPNCDICGKVFKFLSYLKTHKLIHEGKKPHKCDVCGKAFTQLSSLKLHNLIHEGRKPHKCEICGKAFTQLAHLKVHYPFHERQIHKCNICGKAFKRVEGLKMHNLIHEGKAPYNCDVCGKPFTLLSNLKKHNLMHDKQLYKCDICGEGFTWLSHLKAHSTIHEGANLTGVAFVGRFLPHRPI